MASFWASSPRPEVPCFWGRSRESQLKRGADGALYCCTDDDHDYFLETRESSSDLRTVMSDHQRRMERLYAERDRELANAWRTPRKAGGNNE
jgi:hypothetical protein